MTATYRIQIVKLPQATGGWFWRRLWIGSEKTALLFSLEIPEGDVLALIRSSVDLLQSSNSRAPSEGEPSELVASMVSMHKAPPRPTEFENPSGPPPPKNTPISKGT